LFTAPRQGRRWWGVTFWPGPGGPVLIHRQEGKKMVPSDPKLSLNPTPACTAQSFAAGSPAITPQLPAVLFENVGLTPWRPPACAPAGTSISQRPFAPLRRPPVSRLPFQDRSSRPAASMRCRTFAKPVRLTAPSLSPVSPGSGEIDTVNPFLGLQLRNLDQPPDLHSPSGLFVPLRIKALTRPLTERLTSRMCPIALRSPPPALLE